MASDGLAGGLELESSGAAQPDGAGGEPRRAAKSAGDVLRENMPDKLLPRLFKWIQHLFTTFGRDVVIVMAMVYVMQGARTAFLYLAVDYACMDPNIGLGLSAGETALVKATAYLPWSFKPLYGLTFDLVPLRGSHRKNWLMLISIVGGLIATSMAFIDAGSEYGRSLFVVAITANNLCVALCDVLADAMVAEYAKLEKGKGAGNLQVCVFGSQNFGQIILHFFAGDVLEWVGPWPMFVMFGLMQAGIAGIAMILKERPD